MSTVDADVMPREEGVIWISADGHDPRVFLGRKIWQVVFGWFVLSREL